MILRFLVLPAFVIAAGLTLFLSLGCGPAAPKREFAQVTGTVIYKGEPVATGTISFQPPSGPMTTAALDDGGNFTMQAVVGLNRVVIVSREPFPELDPNDMPKEAPPMPVSYIPEHYSTANSPLEFQVESGENTAEFDLKDDPNALPPAPKKQ